MGRVAVVSDRRPFTITLLRRDPELGYWRARVTGADGVAIEVERRDGSWHGERRIRPGARTFRPRRRAPGCRGRAAGTRAVPRARRDLNHHTHHERSHMPDTARRMNLATIAKAGDARRKALERADDRLTAIADEVIAAGDQANVSLAAETARVDRSVLVRRIKARREGSSS